jgi:DNA polymerase-3 subunit alpha
MKDSGKQYVALGMINGIHEIRTKKGAMMAFAKLNDYDGQIDLTFFPKTWEELKPKLEDSGIYAFKGKVDASRDTPSFIVDSMEAAEELEKHSIQSVHIMLNPEFNSESALFELKDFLFDKSGNCSVYFHIKIGNSPYIVKANSMISVTASEETIRALKEMSLVKEVWTE